MTLRPHQIEGAVWLNERRRGYLAHKPGLGKTRTAIAALQLAHAKRPLIVCPAIVRSHWHAEFDAMLPGSMREVFVKSYDEITRGGNGLMVKLLRDEGVDGLILDEAHYLKHAGAARTLQLLGKDGYARRLETVWPLSGTPMPKNPAEIWTVISSLFPEVALRAGLRTYDDFVARHCVTRGGMVRGVWREKVVGVKDEAALRAMLAEVMLVREVDDMPPLDWQMIRLDGGALAADVEGSAMILGALDVIAAGELEEIANDPHVSRMRRRLGELKAAPVVELVRSQLADSDEKLVIFAHHTSVIDALTDGLEQFEPVVVDGRTSDTHRDLRREKFINDPKHRVFIGQNQACGTGMDGLQKVAHRALLVEPSWTASENEQLGRRVARYGGAGYGIAQMVALAGTLDEAIVAQCKREQEMVAAAMPLGV